MNQSTEKKLSITQVTDGIYVIDSNYLDRRDFTCCYLIVDNGELAFVETNTNFAVPYLLEAVSHLGYKPEQVKYVILTHIHLDHAGGTGLLMEKLPEAKLVVHARGRKHMIDPSKLIEGVKAVYGEEKYAEMYGGILPIPKPRVRAIIGSESLTLGNRTLHFFDSPGHAKHHMVIHDPLSGSVFSGDAFGICYPRYQGKESRLVFPSTSPVQFEPEVAMETYKMIRKLDPRRILLTHYGCLEAIEDGHQQLDRWITFIADTAATHYDAGLRDDQLQQQLYHDILDRFDRIFRETRGSGLTEEDKEWLFLDCDINAQGAALYIKKKREKEAAEAELNASS